MERLFNHSRAHLGIEVMVKAPPWASVITAGAGVHRYSGLLTKPRNAAKLRSIYCIHTVGLHFVTPKK